MNKRIELRRSDRAARRLFIVDIENAVGAGKVDSGSCQLVRRRIEKTYKPGNGDLIVVGVSHSGNAFPASTWNGARLVFKRGHDGADLALESVLANENGEERFGEVVIVSGDGAFASQAARLKALGVKVVVDSRPRPLARILAINCSSIRLAPSSHAA